MLEFNIDKQGGIKLHTCERRTRWCKFWLWLSWLSIFSLLGWLFWSGFLSFDKGVDNQLGLSESLNGSQKPQAISSDCPAVEPSIQEGSSDTAILKKKNIALEVSCNEKVSALNLQLKELTGLRKSNQELNASVESFEKSKTNLLKEKKSLAKQLTEKSQENKKLIKQLKAKAVDKGLDPEIEKKLYFYENILAVQDGKQTVNINHFVLKKTNKPSRYRLQIVLAHLGNSNENTKVKGTFEAFLKGNKRVKVNQDEKDSDNNSVVFTKEVVTYKHTDLIPDDSTENSNAFSFTYYQNLENEIILPESFELESVSVIVKPQGLTSLSKNYEWKDLEKLSFKEIK